MRVKHLADLKLNRYQVVLIFLLVVALIVRAYLIPRSAGDDIAQFYGFGNTMLHHGAYFYDHASAAHWNQEGWPYPWPYDYGPVMAYALGLLRALHVGSLKCFWDGAEYYVYISTSWITAVKAMFAAADLGIALLIYRMASRKTTGLLAVAFYLFNPMVLYVSSIYGMFDGLAALAFISGLYALENGRRNLGYGLIGFSLAVKQTMLFPAAVVVWDSLLRRDRRAVGCTVAGFLIPFLPLLPSVVHVGNMIDLMSGIEPGYTVPITYNLNGIVALLTYVHQKAGIETLFYMRYWWVFGLISLAAVLFVHYRLRNLPLSVTLAYAAFLATYWRVNPQYLLPLIAFVALLMVRSRSIQARTVAVITTVPATLWPILFPTGFWFHVHIERPDWHAIHLVDKLTLKVFDVWPFVELSMILTFLLLTFLLWGFFRSLNCGGGCNARADR
ncbi:MAG: DUF2029 domain-containing protein [Thermococci archaeon]|nr:DUF2029 domain-containing protein [Thermococci archaeon]